MKAHQRDTVKNIGSRIRVERKKHKLSLEELSKRLGISKMTLQRIETGTTSPSIIALTEIFYHLKQAIDSLIREGDAKVSLLKKSQQETIFEP
jgi:transcriptional regulator with XRE-family HTH domain